MSRVIDAHTHLYGEEMTPRYWIRAMADYGSSISTRSAEFVMQRIADDWCDPTGDRLVADMDAAGIERSVVFVLDFALHGGVDDGVSLERRYELFAAAVSRHPDRLVLYGGIDPRRPDAAAFVRRAEHEFGIRGVKIWPPAGRCPMTPGRIACMSAARSSGCRWWCTRGRRSARSEASARG